MVKIEANSEDRDDLFKLIGENRRLEVKRFCHGKYFNSADRILIWKYLLKISDDPINVSNILYDLPNQNFIREKCVDTFGDDIENISKAETLITFYQKEYHLVDFEGKMDIICKLLATLLKLNMSIDDTYKIIVKILQIYSIQNDDLVNIILRLLILYHEPELFTFMESKKIQCKQFAIHWIQTLFSCLDSFELILAFWDILFQTSSIFPILFVILIFLINAKDTLLKTYHNKTNEEIIDFIKNIPTSMTDADIPDIVSLIFFYQQQTPYSLIKDFYDVIKALPAVENSETDILAFPLYTDLCIHISIAELFESKNAQQNQSKEGKLESDIMTFFLVDCRPADQYNNGHHPTAFHLDATLMLDDISQFENAVAALMVVQKNSIKIKSLASGKHICFMGMGNESKNAAENIVENGGNSSAKDDMYMASTSLINMVASYFLRHNYQHISILRDGYQGLHEALQNDLNANFAQHNKRECVECVRNSQSYQASNPQLSLNKSSLTSKSFDSGNFLDKFSTAMKFKTKEIKERINNYMVPSASHSDYSISNQNFSPDDLSFSSHQNKNGKSINRVSVFSMDDNDESETDEPFVDNNDNAENGNVNDTPLKNANGPIDKSKLQYMTESEWKTKLEALQTFPCYHLVRNNNLPSILLVNANHIYVLKAPTAQKNAELSTENNLKYMCSFSRPLQSIVKITSRRKNPEIITLKYGRVLTDHTEYAVDGNDSPGSTKESKCVIEVDASDKFYIPDLAGDATKLIKRLIVEQIESR